MRFCYQVATPDVTYDPEITAFQGSLKHSFAVLQEYGYDGVELMTRSPEMVDWNSILRLSQQRNLPVVLICTGEIFVQLGVSFCDKQLERRRVAIEKTKEMIDYAAHFGAIINVGRLRGEYLQDVPHSDTDSWLIAALQELGEYGNLKGVSIAIETVGRFQTNFINTLEQAYSVVDKVNRDSVKVMMDIFHMQLEEADYLASIEKYQDYNIHVHLADSNRHYPGDGNLSFDEIIKRFATAGYNGNFTTEITQWPDQETAARKSMEYMAPIFLKYYGRPV